LYNISVVHRIPAEIEDYLELRDPKVREHIRKSREEFEAGKGRPLSEFLSEIAPLQPEGRKIVAHGVSRGNEACAEEPPAGGGRWRRRDLSARAGAS
jgi:hypothetical protein